MKTLPEGADQALAPLRRRLAEAAEQQAAALVGAAEAEAAAMLEAARLQAESIRAEAERSGEESATETSRARSAQARRRAHSLVLAAASEVRERVRSEVLAAAAKLPADPRYPALRARLIERGRTLLGDEATVEDAIGGGVLLINGERRLDLSLGALAGQAMDAHEQELAALWQV